MALYPFSVGAQVPAGMQPLAPGTAICFPITLEAAGRLMIDLVQATGEAVQDFTIRGWISTQPLGSPNPSLPAYLQTWQANKTPGVIVFTLFDPTGTGPSTQFQVPAAPGQYFMNILNLTNQSNQFWLTVTDPADTDDFDV